LLFEDLTCLKIEKNHPSASQSGCDFQKCFYPLLQQMSGELIEPAANKYVGHTPAIY